MCIKCGAGSGSAKSSSETIFTLASETDFEESISQELEAGEEEDEDNGDSGSSAALGNYFWSLIQKQMEQKQKLRLTNSTKQDDQIEKQLPPQAKLEKVNGTFSFKMTFDQDMIYPTKPYPKFLYRRMFLFTIISGDDNEVIHPIWKTKKR